MTISIILVSFYLCLIVAELARDHEANKPVK